jgi:predicted RNase H-like HicB family nuclease
MNTSSLEDFKALDYPVRIEYEDEDGLFVADFLDLPGCSATGPTVPEAYERAQEAKVEWLRVTLEQGLPVPKPTKSQEYGGRILVRLPVSLHAVLADRAHINGVSLNQYVVHLLSAGAMGEQVTSKLEAVTGRLRNIEYRLAAGFACLGGAPWEGMGHSRMSGLQIPYQLFAAPRLPAGSASDLARIT